MSSMELIKKLRDATGSGIVDCKKALSENNNDINASVKWLREKGILKAQKKQDRETNEGVVSFYNNETYTDFTVCKIKCETDFVAKNDDFLDFAKTLSKAIHENKNINEDYFFFVDDWMINFDTSLKKIYNHFDVKTLKGFGISDNSLGVISASMILHYLEDSHKKRLVHIKKINPINNNSFLLMDRFTISNLELVNSKFPG